MSETVSFDFLGQGVRVIERFGNTWFAARDAAAVLGITKSGSTFGKFPANEKGWYTISTLGGSQKLLFINEPGLYRLIFLSRKEEAERFKTWVFETVLPAIRKYGFYSLTSPNALPGPDEPRGGTYIVNGKEVYCYKGKIYQYRVYMLADMEWDYMMGAAGKPR